MNDDPEELLKALKRLRDFNGPWSIGSRRSGFAVDVWPGADGSDEGPGEREYGMNNDDSLAKTINTLLDRIEA